MRAQVCEIQLHRRGASGARASVICRIAELNPNVRVLAHSGGLTEELVGEHNAVIFTQVSPSNERAPSLPDACSSHPMHG